MSDGIKRTQRTTNSHFYFKSEGHNQYQGNLSSHRQCGLTERARRRLTGGGGGRTGTPYPLGHNTAVTVATTTIQHTPVATAAMERAEGSSGRHSIVCLEDDTTHLGKETTNVTILDAG